MPSYPVALSMSKTQAHAGISLCENQDETDKAREKI